MKHPLIKTASIALSGILLLGALSACGGGKPSETATSAMDTSATTAGITSATQMSPNVPSADYGGYTFTFLTHQEPVTNADWITPNPRELVADSETGDLINDAVYKRNSVITQQFNVQFAMVPILDEAAALKKSVAAGDNAYDCSLIFNNNVPTVVTGNLLMNVADLKYIDISQPWWDPGANSMTIDNQRYVLAGDLTILDKAATNCLLFNKDMIAALGMQSPYDLVTGGNWTFDALNSMVKGTYSDLNGDGKVNIGDRFGLLTYNDTMHAFLVAGGGQMASKDANDEPVMTLGNADCINIATQAMGILYNKQDVLNFQGISSAAQQVVPNYQAMFTQGDVLFIWVRMGVVEMIRDSDVNFGIIPLPKLDASQDKYRSVVNPYSGVMIGIPKTCPDTDRTGTILEALSCESMYTLQPAYYDLTLQRKMIRDTDSSAMLDIIFGNRIYDIGAVYSFGGCFSGYISLYGSVYNTDIASYYAKNQSKMDAAIAKVVAIFQGNA